MKIHPSLLAVKSEIKSAIESVRCPWLESIHFDIGDNIFVPSYMLSTEAIKEVPDDMPMDIHLMVQKPSTYFRTLLKHKNIHSIAFHIETDEDIRENINMLRRNGKKVGLCILHDTPTDHIDPYLLEIDYVIVMTILGGFSGTPFLIDTLPKIHEIRQKNPALPIMVDGWINEETLRLCANQWATDAVVSSALFAQKDRKKYLKLLSSISST